MEAGAYLTICILMWGMAIFTMKLAGQGLDPMTLAVFNAAGQLIIGILLFSRANIGIGKYHLMGIAVGVLFVLGNMAFYKLSQTSQVSTLAPMTALHIAVPIVLGIVLLGEPVSVRKGIGVLFALVALYLLSNSDS
jgi:transporter family protein